LARDQLSSSQFGFFGLRSSPRVKILLLPRRLCWTHCCYHTNHFAAASSLTAPLRMCPDLTDELSYVN
jgi:hypothetical protein